MKNTLYAAVAACMAMLATSGLVALATAAPVTTPVWATGVTSKVISAPTSVASSA